MQRSKVLVHCTPHWGPIGVWREGAEGWESYYEFPLDPKAFQQRTRELLDTCGYATNHLDWMMSLQNRHPYADYYDLVEEPESDQLSVILQRVKEAVEEKPIEGKR